MNEFAASIARWSSFFSTLAAVSATLAGLLFVSVTLRHRILHARRLASVRRLALHAFRSFLFLVVLSMTFLVPDPTPVSAGLPLLCIGLYAGVNGLRLMRADHADCEASLIRVPGAGRAYIVSMLTYVGVCASAIGLMAGYAYSTFAIVGFLIWNLARATENAWNVLSVDDHAHE